MFGTFRADNATTFVSTTPEDANRIVTTTIFINPVNYLNFVSPHAAKYEHAYYCTAFIGNFINDHVVSDGTCLEGLCKHLKNMREREGGREREGEGE